MDRSSTEYSGKPPLRKAREINAGKQFFGTFAEIGAGQEVAGTFLLAGKAGNTVAKIMSAYAMQVSDAIYLEGFPEPRRIPHTSRYRLQAMLEHEHKLMIDRFVSNKENADELKRGRKGLFPCLFTYANTLSSGDGYGGGRTFHGWMGVRIQSKSKGKFSGIESERGLHVDLLAHVVLLEHDRRAQYQTIGNMGVNLIYAACNLLSSPIPIDYPKFVRSLFDGINLWKARVDVLEINPSHHHTDLYNTTKHSNRELSLLVVQESLSHEALISPRKFAIPAELCSATRYATGYTNWREKLDERQGSSTVDDWAYPQDEIRVPVRFLSFKHNYLIPARLRTQQGADQIVISETTATQFSKFNDEKSIPVILLPSKDLRRGKNALDFEVFDDSYETWRKKFDTSAVLITKSNDLGWVVESIRRTLLDPTQLTLVIDHTQWISTLEFNFLKPKAKLLADAKKAQSSERRSDIAREAAQLSADSIDCLQRIERARCKIQVLCEAEDLDCGKQRSKPLDSYVKYLQEQGTLVFANVSKSA